MFLPSYTAAAWYHKKLSPELQNKPLTDVLKLAEDFASHDYLLALSQGDSLNAEAKKKSRRRCPASSDYRRTMSISSTFACSMNYSSRIFCSIGTARSVVWTAASPAFATNPAPTNPTSIRATKRSTGRSPPRSTITSVAN